MTTKIKLWARVLATVAALALILYFAAPLIARILGGTIALSVFLVNVLLPLGSVLVLGWFAYSLFLRRYLRVWRIKRIRDARYLREVLERGRKGN